MRLVIGLQAGLSFARRNWVLRPCFKGERVEFEVGNYAETPPFVHLFPDAYEAAWFFLNVSPGEIVDLARTTD